MGTGASVAVQDTEKLGSRRRTKQTWKYLPDANAIRVKYEQDNSISPDCSEDVLELRYLLDEPLAVAHMSSFAQSESPKLTQLMGIWRRVQVMKTMSSGVGAFRKLVEELIENLRRDTRASPVLMDLGALAAKLPKPCLLPGLSWPSSTVLAPEHIQCLQRLLVDVLYERLFVPFCETSEYDSMLLALRGTYNAVGVGDFDYGDMIAEGGFGLVLQGTRKSTGINYAIKVQPKAALLRHFGSQPARVIQEMQAHACCNHPFVAKLAYAFCTETMAILVLPLAECGDLGRSLNMQPCGCMPLDRVQFYAAEIVSALCYLHSHGILYRDLKPGNILLNADGHIMLSDFGSVADLDHALCVSTDSVAYDGSRGVTHDVTDTDFATPFFSMGSSGGSFRGGVQVAESTNNSRSQAGHWTQLYRSATKPQLPATRTLNSNVSETSHASDADFDRAQFLSQPASRAPSLSCVSPSATEEKLVISPSPSVGGDVANVATVASTSKRRSKSLVGTLSYMAPEIVCLIGRKDPSSLTDCGYTEAVDWWSLGCTIYKLLTGMSAFKSMPYEKVRRYFPALQKRFGSVEEAFVSMFGEPEFLLCGSLLTPESVDVITQFLQMSPERRLGTDRLDEKGELMGGGGVAEITSHPFFKGIDWKKLEAKELQPPYNPRMERAYCPDNCMGFTSNEASLDHVLVRCNKDHWVSTGFNSPARSERCGSGVGSADTEDAATGRRHTTSVHGLLQSAANILSVAPQRGFKYSKPVVAPHASHQDQARSKTPKSSVQVPAEQQVYFTAWTHMDADLIELEKQVASAAPGNPTQQ